MGAPERSNPDDNFSEMRAAFHVSQCLTGLVEGKNPVDDRPELMQRDSTIHRLKHIP
jgi:hypothetical protein